MRGAVSLSLITALLLLGAPSYAADQKPKRIQKINVVISDEMRKANEPYLKKLETLTPEQVEQLDQIDADFSKVVEPDLKLGALSTHIEECLKIDQMPQADADQFLDFKKFFAPRQDARIRTFVDQSVAKTPYMEPKAMRDHLTYQMLITLQMSEQLLRLSSRTKPATKARCAETQQELKDMFAAKP